MIGTTVGDGLLVDARQLADDAKQLKEFADRLGSSGLAATPDDGLSEIVENLRSIGARQTGLSRRLKQVGRGLADRVEGRTGGLREVLWQLFVHAFGRHSALFTFGLWGSAGLCLGLAAVAPEGLARVAFIVAALLWILAVLPVASSLDDLVLAFARVHHGRYKVAFVLSLMVACWTWGVGLFAECVLSELLHGRPRAAVKASTQGVVLSQPQAKGSHDEASAGDIDGGVPATLHPSWSFPWGRILDASILTGTLLGVATIYGLLITFAEIREHLKPRAMNLREALERAATFIQDYSNRNCGLRLCSYYPNIGVVNRSSYEREYEEFIGSIKHNRVECICLPLAATENVDPFKMADSVVARRARTIGEAVAAFTAIRCGGQSDAERVDATEHYEKAIQDVINEITYMNKFTDNVMVRHVSVVPDFHFLLATGGSGVPSAAFVLIPLRPAGMPEPGDPAHSRVGGEPPMIGMEVHDSVILSHLDSLYRLLAQSPAGA